MGTGSIGPSPASVPISHRSRLQRLIESQHVTLDGVPSRAAARLRSGQRIRVTVPEQPPSRLEPSTSRSR